MIDFEDELKKFQPILEVDEAEDAIYGIDAPDLAELIGKIVDEVSDK